MLASEELPQVICMWCSMSRAIPSCPRWHQHHSELKISYLQGILSDKVQVDTVMALSSCLFLLAHSPVRC